MSVISSRAHKNQIFWSQNFSKKKIISFYTDFGFFSIFFPLQHCAEINDLKCDLLV